MALEKTLAIVLRTFDWSESSRTIAFFAKEFGRIYLADKGGKSIKSKRGRVIKFALLEVTFYDSKKETSGYISDVELIKMYHMSGDGSLGRLAYASAACELLEQLLPKEEPQRTLFSYFNLFMEKLDNAERKSLPALFLSFFLRLLSQLGYHPSLGYCVGCSREYAELKKEKPGNFVPFSPERGGIICPSCQTPGDYYIKLPADVFAELLKLQSASLKEAESVRISYGEASLLLEALVKFLQYQAEISSKIKSLEFLDKLKKTELTSE